MEGALEGKWGRENTGRLGRKELWREVGRASRNQSASHTGCCDILLDVWNGGAYVFLRCVLANG